MPFTTATARPAVPALVRDRGVHEFPSPDEPGEIRFEVWTASGRRIAKSDLPADCVDDDTLARLWAYLDAKDPVLPSRRPCRVLEFPRGSLI